MRLVVRDYRTGVQYANGTANWFEYATRKPAGPQEHIELKGEETPERLVWGMVTGIEEVAKAQLLVLDLQYAVDGTDRIMRT